MKNLVLFSLILILLGSCIKEPIISPNHKGGTCSFEVEGSEDGPFWWSDPNIYTIKGAQFATENGGAYTQKDYIYINLFQKGPNGVEMMIDIRVDQSLDYSNNPLNDVNFTLVYDSLDVAQEISGFSKGVNWNFHPGAIITITKNQNNDPDYIEVIFDAVIYDKVNEDRGVITEPELKHINLVHVEAKAFFIEGYEHNYQ